jgi:hypothetical protein
VWSSVQQNINFVDVVETQLRKKKPLQTSQTQDIHYLENKDNNKAGILTYP